MKLFETAAVAIGAVAMFAVLVIVVTYYDASGASAATTDTIVNVETHANPYGDQFIVVAPAGWAQPVYGIWVTGDCAATLSVGDSWPAVSPLCQ